jgi:hypothetical protein
LGTIINGGNGFGRILSFPKVETAPIRTGFESFWHAFRGKTVIGHFYLYSDFRKLFFDAAAVQKSMKPGHIFILVLNLLISLALVCVVVRLCSNGQEKDRIIQELQAQKEVDARKALKAQQEEEVQKQFEAQIKLEAQKQLEAKKMRMINDDLDKIDARLKRVLDEPSGYVDETKAQRDTQEELLRQLANAARTEIEILAGEMQNAGFTNDASLQENLDRFFKNYETKIHNDRLSCDYVDLGLKDSDHKQELDAEAARALQTAFAAKRAIHNLKQVQK